MIHLCVCVGALFLYFFESDLLTSLLFRLADACSNMKMVGLIYNIIEYKIN